MKKANFTSIGISVLIVLNLVILSLLFINRPGRHGFHGQMRAHDHERMDAGSHPVKDPRDADMRDHFRHELMDSLSLTADQKAKIETIRKEHRQKSEALMDKLGELRKKETDLANQGKLDNGQINALAIEFGLYQKELHLLRLNQLQAIGTILTKEQREKFQKDMGEKRMGWKRHHGFRD